MSDGATRASRHGSLAHLGDTAPEVHGRLIAGYRAMSPAVELAQVVALNRAVESLARAGIRARHGGEIPEDEVRLRLAALRLPRHVMVDVFGWDPAERGYQDRVEDILEVASVVARVLERLGVRHLVARSRPGT